ncbi:hypothetical protein KQH54_02575 [bacterium]|nr:hypothetical protein [bacterium]
MPNKRQLNDTDDFLDELEIEDNPTQPIIDPPKPKAENTGEKKSSRKKLTSGQKFFLSILFFLLVLTFGFFIMLITGTMVLP